MRCPRCDKDISKNKWGDTGMNPSQHVLVKKCKCSGELITEREIVDAVIQKNLKRLQFLKKVHHSWPDSEDLVVQESGCTTRMVISRLMHYRLW